MVLLQIHVLLDVTPCQLVPSDPRKPLLGLPDPDEERSMIRQDTDNNLQVNMFLASSKI